ncbi:MAG: 3-isopropylmalate dehydratase [Planctomycetota bacterium]|nr:3-isopropylmalate dehydratase [Planctomycetota bacterium]
MKINGRCFKYGDDINTDVIFPGKYTYTVSEPSEMAQHAMEDLDPSFSERVSEGDIVVAGSNFGCGSSREQAVICLREAGIRAVVARSFSRIYYRNCINSGLVPIQSEAADVIQDGETIEIDLENGVLLCDKGEFTFPPFAGEVARILSCGGLIPYTRKLLGIENR